jgi:hypothetical protein
MDHNANLTVSFDFAADLEPCNSKRKPLPASLYGQSCKRLIAQFFAWINGQDLRLPLSSI